MRDGDPEGVAMEVTNSDGGGLVFVNFDTGTVDPVGGESYIVNIGQLDPTEADTLNGCEDWGVYSPEARAIVARHGARVADLVRPAGGFFVTVDSRHVFRHQSHCWTEVRVYGGLGRVSERLKVDIVRNAYDDQSHARVYAWSPVQGWLLIVDHGIEDYECYKSSYVSPWTDDMRDKFIRSADRLFDIGEQFLELAKLASGDDETGDGSASINCGECGRLLHESDYTRSVPFGVLCEVCAGDDDGGER